MALYNADEMVNWSVQTCYKRKAANGELHDVWCAARPVNHRFDSLWLRIKLAFGVLVGKYDALDWACDTPCRTPKVAATTDQA